MINSHIGFIGKFPYQPVLPRLVFSFLLSLLPICIPVDIAKAKDWTDDPGDCIPYFLPVKLIPS